MPPAASATPHHAHRPELDGSGWASSHAIVRCSSLMTTLWAATNLWGTWGTGEPRQIPETSQGVTGSLSLSRPKLGLGNRGTAPPSVVPRFPSHDEAMLCLGEPLNL